MIEYEAEYLLIGRRKEKTVECVWNEVVQINWEGDALGEIGMKKYGVGQVWGKFSWLIGCTQRNLLVDITPTRNSDWMYRNTC